MIMDKARELGIALSESKEYQDYINAKDALEKDEVVQAMMEDFREKQAELIELLGSDSASSDVISTLNSDLQHAQQDLYSHPLFLEMLNAQSALQALLARVNRVIGELIGINHEESSSSGCGGSCSSCSGCVH